MYVIVREDGVFVAPPGRASSYARGLQDARIFSTRESAERERCTENERVVPVEEVFNGLDRRYAQ